MLGVTGAARQAWSERVLPRAKLGEHRDTIGQIAPGVTHRCGANRGIGSAQKRIGGTLLGDGRWKRRVAAIALRLIALETRAQSFALRLDGQREAKVRDRVLVPAVDARVGRQGGELVQR